MGEAKTKLGRMLRSMRKAEGLSLRKYAEKIEISHAYLDKLERGVDVRTGKEITPTIDVLLKISQNLKVDPGEFLYKCGYLNRPAYIVSEGRPESPLDIYVCVTTLLERLSVSHQVVAKNKILTEAQVASVAKTLSALAEAL